MVAGAQCAFFGMTINGDPGPVSSSGSNSLWGLDTLVPCTLSLIEPVDTTIQYQAEASPMCHTSARRKCAACATL